MSDRVGDYAGVVSVLGDLLPVLIPGARLDEASNEILVPIEGGRARVSVDSLLARTGGQPPERWSQLIESWTADVLDQLQRPAPSVTVDDLRVRLVPRGPVVEDQLIVKPYGAYFQLELMADLPDRRVWVGPARADGLGLAADEAFSHGLRNTITKVLVGLDVRQHEVGNGLTISLAAADGVPWVSLGLTSVSKVFHAPELPFGAIVAVPRLSALSFTAVESDRVMADIVVISRIVAGMYRDSDDPCSPDVFWLHDGQLYRIESGDGTRVTVPVELEPVVAALPASR